MGWITVGRGSWCTWKWVIVVWWRNWWCNICFTRYLWGVMWWFEYGHLPGCIPLVSIADTTGLAFKIAGRWTSRSPPFLPAGIGWFRSSTGKEGGSAWCWRWWVCEVSVVRPLSVGASAAGVVLQPVLHIIHLFSAAWGASMIFANRNGARDKNLRR